MFLSLIFGDLGDLGDLSDPRGLDRKPEGWSQNSVLDERKGALE